MPSAKVERRYALMIAKDALTVTGNLSSFIRIPGVALILSVLHVVPGVAQVRFLLFPAVAIEVLFLWLGCGCSW